MSYTKHYLVSTKKDDQYISAIVTSGHAKGALHKFLVHIDLSNSDTSNNITKIIDEYGLKRYSIGGKYIVEVKRINIYDDFILLKPVNIDDK